MHFISLALKAQQGFEIKMGQSSACSKCIEQILKLAHEKSHEFVKDQQFLDTDLFCVNARLYLERYLKN